MTRQTFPQITLVRESGHDIESMLVSAGVHVTAVGPGDLPGIAGMATRSPEAVMVDLRGAKGLPPAVAMLRRNHPNTPVVIVVTTLDPVLMLEAMRAGVTEVVPEPVTRSALEAAVTRVWQPRDPVPQETGKVFGVLGAKGGIGATTIAVNLATVLEQEAEGQSLLMDMHVAQGDASLLLGAEPRFSVVDALENTHRLDEAYFRSLVVGTNKGPALLASSERHIVGSPAPDRVRAVIDFARTVYRYVVLDLPRTDLNTLDGLDAAEQLVVVANQELSSVRTATRLVDALSQRYGRNRVALALSRYDKGAEIDTAAIEKVVGIPVTYIVPNDYREAVKAANQGVPMAIAGTGKVAPAMREMACQMAGLPQPEAQPAKGGLLGMLSLKRVTPLF
jgi:pilus assembly protein CpaE